MTRNPQAVIDEEGFAVRRTIRIDAPVAKVWRAVTDPAHISTWFGRVQLDGVVGIISWPDRDPIPLRVESIDAQRSVSYRWNNDDALGTSPAAIDAETSTVFTFSLEPVPGGTQLTVVETGFERTSAPGENLASHVTGWTIELDKLVAVLEGGA